MISALRDNWVCEHGGCSSKLDITYSLKKKKINGVCQHGGCDSRQYHLLPMEKVNGVRKQRGMRFKIRYHLLAKEEKNKWSS